MNFPAGLIKLSRRGDLSCPDCGRPMQPYRCDTVTIDMCADCAGIWFDSKEIGIFRQALSRFDYTQMKIDPPSTSVPDAIRLYECPRCLEPLCKGTFGYNSGVHVHSCTTCRGLWVPLTEIVNLIGLAKRSQDLAPELAGFLNEWTKMETEGRRFAKLRSLTRILMTRVPRTWGLWW